jgi:hypothetical protein
MNTSTSKSAEEDSVATWKFPPPWAESLLRHVLEPRNQESILGDFLEEYREEQLPVMGRARANLWYIRQILSIVSFQALSGDSVKRSLIFLCFFTLAASACIGSMEAIQRQPGYQIRIIGAIMLAAASFVTIFYLVLPGYRLLRILVSLGAGSMLSLGTSATLAVIRCTPFESYMLLIPAVMILEFALAILTLAYVPDPSGARFTLT